MTARLTDYEQMTGEVSPSRPPGPERDAVAACLAAERAGRGPVEGVDLEDPGRRAALRRLAPLDPLVSWARDVRLPDAPPDAEAHQDLLAITRLLALRLLAAERTVRALRDEGSNE